MSIKTRHFCRESPHRDLWLEEPHVIRDIVIGKMVTETENQFLALRVANKVLLLLDKRLRSER